MSKATRLFVESFFKGWGYGLQWQDLAQRAEERKEQRQVEREKIAMTERHHKEQIALGRETLAQNAPLKAAQAHYYMNRGAGGGAGGGGLDPASQKYLAEHGYDGSGGGGGGDTTQPVVSDEGDEGSAIGAARGGRIPKMASGGRARRQALMTGIINAGQTAANNMMRGARNPGITEDWGRNRRVPTPTMTRGASVPIAPSAPPPSAGTNGPGSGYGQIAAPPVTAGIDTGVPEPQVDQGTYRRGGLVKRFQSGGSVDTPPEGRIVYDENGQPVWLTPGDMPMTKLGPGGGTYGGNTFGGKKFGGAEFGGNKFGGNTFGGNKYGGGEYGGYKTNQFTPPVVTRDPGETGGFPEKPAGEPTGMTVEGQEYPQNTAGPVGPLNAPPPSRGRGRAINTGERPWKKLGDQTRDEAYDPIKDALDERNIAAIDREGRMQPHVNQRVIMDEQGMVSRVENPVPGGSMPGRQVTPGRDVRGQPTVAEPLGGEGLQGRAGQNRGLSTNNAAADYSSGAAAYANSVAQNDPQAVYNGAGAADTQVMNNIMKIIDPQGQMSPSDRMETATKVVHEFYMQQGNPQAANQAAGEIAQAGIQHSRTFGAKAMQLLQRGDVMGAAQQLVQGYDYMPNGQRATIQGNNIVVMKGDQPVMTIPINPQTLQNLAMGMAVGKLGWDVMGYQPQMAATQPPMGGPTGGGPTVAQGPPSRPAAQPQAAQAGPVTSPPAASPTVNIDAITKKYAGPAISTTTPTQLSSPPPQNAGAGTGTPPSSAQPAPAQTKPKEGAKPPTKGKTIDDLEKEHYEKSDNKRGVTPFEHQSEAEQAAQAKIDHLERYSVDLHRQLDKERVAAVADAKSRVPRKDWDKVVKKVEDHIKARYAPQIKKVDERRKELRADFVEERKRARSEATPRTFQSGESANVQTNIGKRLETIEQEKGDAYTHTPVEHLKVKSDRKLVADLALALYQQNNKMTEEQAADLAASLTAISPTGRSPHNQGEGKDALAFKTRRRPGGGYVVIPKSGRAVNVDGDTLNAIHSLQDKTWRAYAEKKAADDKAAADDEARTPTTKALRAIGRMVPGGGADYGRSRAGMSDLE